MLNKSLKSIGRTTLKGTNDKRIPNEMQRMTHASKNHCQGERCQVIFSKYDRRNND